jgi:hypothetical protein
MDYSQSCCNQYTVVNFSPGHPCSLNIRVNREKVEKDSRYLPSSFQNCHVLLSMLHPEFPSQSNHSRISKAMVDRCGVWTISERYLTFIITAQRPAACCDWTYSTSRPSAKCIRNPGPNSPISLAKKNVHSMVDPQKISASSINFATTRVMYDVMEFFDCLRNQLTR